MTDYDQTGPAPLPEGRTRKRLTFDPTINAGHILTFVMMLMALFAGWTAIDKRVVVLEEARIYQQRRDDAQDVVIKESLADIKQAVKDVSRGVEEIRREQRPPRP